MERADVQFGLILALADVHPVHVGQPEVQHDDVGRADGRLGQPVAPGHRGPHLVAQRVQPDGADDQAQHGDHEDHDCCDNEEVTHALRMRAWPVTAW